MPVEPCLIMPSPVGKLLLRADHNGLAGLVILADIDGETISVSVQQNLAIAHSSMILLQATEQLGEYFAGHRREFHLPFVLKGLPAFTRKILEVLQSVPFGATITYGELAKRAGFPRAARAVGGAMAANPLPIVIPCHRVIAAAGRTGGYSGGGGLRTKEWLLTFERNNYRAN